MRYKRFVAAILTAAMLIVSMPAVSAATPPNGQAVYQGVDIYNGTSQVDWPMLSGEKQFAYIKAEEGEHTPDVSFYSNASGAKSVGMAWGPYHFLHIYGVESAKLQADYFWTRIRGTGYTLVPMVDVELTDKQEAPEISRDVLAFCQTFKKLSGTDPIVYTYVSFANNFFVDPSIGRYKLWIANYGVSQPGDLKLWGAWDAWQYSDTGRIAGIHNHYVDLDVATANIYLSTPQQPAQSAGSSPATSSDVYRVGSLPYAVNAAAGTDFDVRNSNGIAVAGREVSKGDPMIVLGVNYDAQLAEVLYPSYSNNCWMHGFIRNLESYIHNTGYSKWLNGSTSEPVYNASGAHIGTIYPHERATILYRSGDRTAILYGTNKGSETKSGYVAFAGVR